MTTSQVSSQLSPYRILRSPKSLSGISWRLCVFPRFNSSSKLTSDANRATIFLKVNGDLTTSREMVGVSSGRRSTMLDAMVQGLSTVQCGMSECADLPSICQLICLGMMKAPPSCPWSPTRANSLFPISTISWL